MTEQTHIPSSVDLRKYIDTHYFGARPHIRGRRVPISFVVSALKENHLSIAEISEVYSLTDAEVLAALLFYEEHQDLIDTQDKAEISAFEENSVQDDSN